MPISIARLEDALKRADERLVDLGAKATREDINRIAREEILSANRRSPDGSRESRATQNTDRTQDVNRTRSHRREHHWTIDSPA